ncbi:MAG: Ig-like domain-containing protein [Deltaproteobacteria bacterium]|nr:Ig-like domain-containing protein [Deltaproteobacteria bacterium]
MIASRARGLLFVVLQLVLVVLASGCSVTPTSGTSEEKTSVSVDALTVVTAVAITPPFSTLPSNTTQQLRATATLSNGRTRNVTVTGNWASDSPAIATVDASGVVLARAPGVATITATSGGVLGSTTITVTGATPVSIAVTPPKRKLAKGATTRFRATATFSDGTTHALAGPVVSWTSSDPAVATIGTDGRATTLKVGTTTIRATHVASGVSGTATLTVSGGPLVSIAVSPPTPTLPVGVQVPMTAIATYADGSTLDVTKDVIWSSSAAAVAGFESSADAGLATALSPGATVITAKDPKTKKRGTATLTVVPVTLESLTLSPPAPEVPVGGGNVQLIATGLYNDKRASDVTTMVTWSSSTPGVASVSNADSSRGLVTPASAGTTTITASDPTTGLVASVTFTVTPAALTSLLIHAPVTMLPLGTTEQLTATGTYSDGTSRDVTGLVTWASSAPAVVVSNDPASVGQATAAATGWANVSVTDPATGLSATTSLVATAAVLRTLAVTPASASLAIGRAQTFSATGTFSDGTVQDVSTAVTWSSSAPSVAYVSNAGDAGTATATGVGLTTITALHWATGRTATAQLNVTPAVLEAIMVTPGATTVPVGWEQPFVAMGTYSDRTTRNTSASVTWSVSSPNATVANGPCANVIVTGTATGTATVSATDAATGVVGSGQITLTPDFPSTSILKLRLRDPNGRVLTSDGSSSSQRVVVGSSVLTPDCTGTFAGLVATGKNNLSVEWYRLDRLQAIPDSFSLVGSFDVLASTTADVTIPVQPITFRVLDPAGLPVANATVSTSGFSSPMGCGAGSLLTGCYTQRWSSSRDTAGNVARTDASGLVTLYALPTQNNAYVYATPPESSDLLPRQIMFSTTSTTPVDIQLPQGYPLTFRLLDINGAVIDAPSARVVVGSTLATPDASARYSALIPAGASTNLLVDVPYLTSTRALPDSFTFGATLSLSGPTTVDVTIPVQPITFRVLDPAGLPVANATVSTSGFSSPMGCGAGSLLTSCYTQRWSSSRDTAGNVARTDASGLVTLYALPTQNNAYVYATPPEGSDLLPRQITFSTTSTTPVDIQLPQGYRLTFRLLDISGAVVDAPSAHVVIGSTVATPDASARYSALVPAGASTNLSVDVSYLPSPRSLPDSFSFRGSLSLSGPTTLDITVPVQPVTFRVLDPTGLPVPNATLSTSGFSSPMGCGAGSPLTSCYTQRWSSSRDTAGNVARTDASGLVTLYALPTQNNAYVYATPPEGSDLLPRQITFSTTSAVPIDVPFL